MSGYSKACAQIAKVMQDGGYFDAIMSSGPDLARVKDYLLAFAGRHILPCGSSLQNPGYPCFPGLHHEAFRDVSAAPGVAVLEQSFGVIRDEYLALEAGDYLRYTPHSMTNLWAVHLLYHMGVDFEALTERCPKTFDILRKLPRICLDYPYGDALFSVHASDSHLKPHCSIDNLRVRCHLGIEIPTGCEMRVGTEIRGWQEGKGLLFEDSFEHEVWNRGSARRALLIIDFWHPDLTDIEIRALTAGFRKSEVRRIFFLERIKMIRDMPNSYIDYLEAALSSQDNDPLLKEFWTQ